MSKARFAPTDCRGVWECVRSAGCREGVPAFARKSRIWNSGFATPAASLAMSNLLRNIALVIGVPSSDTISRVDRTLCADFRFMTRSIKTLSSPITSIRRLAFFSLQNPDLAFPNITLFHKSTVCHSLVGQIGRIHGVTQTGVRLVMHTLE